MNSENSHSQFGYEEAAIVRAMIQHENELRNNRIMWFITIEGLLFAALGFAWKDAALLVYVLCFLGLLTAISFSRELRLSSLGLAELKNWWQTWLDTNGHQNYRGPSVIGLDLNTLPKEIKPWGITLRPARVLPWLFVLTWAVLATIYHFTTDKPTRVDVHMLPRTATAD